MILHTDGGARGNPGPGAAAAVLSYENGEVLVQKGIYLGVCTNNDAEYEGLKLGLELAHAYQAKSLVCYLDSELVVKQLKGEYKVKNDRLQILFTQVKQLATNFESVSFMHVPRAKNKLADKLVNEVLDSSMTQ